MANEASDALSFASQQPLPGCFPYSKNINAQPSARLSVFKNVVCTLPCFLFDTLFLTMFCGPLAFKLACVV